MNKTTRQIAIFLFCMALCTFTLTKHSSSQNNCMMVAPTVIAISKLLFTQEELVNKMVLNYNGADIAYFRNPFDTSMVMDTAISHKKIVHNDVAIYFLDYLELIYFNVMIWLQFENIHIEQNRIHVNFLIVSKHREKGEVQKLHKAVFECISDEIKLISLEL